jgi:hypothetical protein
MVTIDGKMEPDKLPQYLVWRRALSGLAAMGHSGLRQELALTEQQASLVLTATAQEFVAEAAVLKPMEALLLQERRDSAAPAGGRIMQDLELQRRAIVLAHADALVDALTGDGRNRLLAWVDRIRSTISITVAESDLPFFLQPR